MKSYDFDSIIDRRGTNSLKTDFLQARYGSSRLIPMWVADMDFATPDFITDAIEQRMAHPVLGYTREPDAYRFSIIRWLQERYGLIVRPEWLTYIPGIVRGIGMAINVFSEKGDKIIIQPPVYHPFRLVPEGNEREVVFNPLKLENGRYSMDFEQLEQVAADEKCKLLILSSPHNPGGVVWSRPTLERLADICARNKVLVLADEIHADMALFGHKFTPFANVSSAAKHNSITFGAPSKTFNMPGIVASFAVVPNNALRQRFYSWLQANEMNEAPLFSYIATEAAYTHGRGWLKQLLRYIEGNVMFTENFFARHIPDIVPMRPEASFLIWLDCRALNLSRHKLVELFVSNAGLALNDGAMFGPGGEGFMRLNVGCSRYVLRQALQQLAKAMKNRTT